MIKINLNDKGNKVINLNNNSRDIEIIGEPLGAYYKDTLYYKNELINKLSSNKIEESNFKQLISHSVGEFYVIRWFAKRVLIICSPSHPGVFYFTKKSELIISESEKKLYNNYNLSPKKEVINSNVMRHVSKRIPFVSNFEKLSHVPFGTELIINTNNYEISQNHYFINELIKSDDFYTINDFEEFKKRMDNVAKLFAQKDVNIMLSGGIDSVAIACAFSDIKQVNCIHWKRSIYEESRAKSLANHIGHKFKSIPFKIKTNINEIVDLMKCKTGTSLPNCFYNYSIKHYDNNDKEKIYLNGNGTSLYTMRTFDKGLPVFTDIFKKYYKYNKGQIESNYINRSFYEYENFKELNINELRNFVLASALSYDEKVPNDLTKYDRIYNQQIKNNIIKPTWLDSDFMNKWEIYLKYRYQRYLEFTQGFLQKDYFFRYAGYGKYTPFYTSGPILSYFMKYKLTSEDSIESKKLLYQYVNNKIGKDYKKDTIKKTLLPTIYKILGLMDKPKDNNTLNNEDYELLRKIFKSLSKNKNDDIYEQCKFLFNKNINRKNNDMILSHINMILYLQK